MNLGDYYGYRNFGLVFILINLLASQNSAYCVPETVLSAWREYNEVC